MKSWSLCGLLVLWLAAPLGADAPPLAPQPAMVLQVGHGGGILALADAAGGKTLVSGSWDYTTRLWDVEADQSLGPLLGSQFSGPGARAPRAARRGALSRLKAVLSPGSINDLGLRRG